ncbi:MAG: LysR family transcriptional regulator [Rhodobacteraceae bacterium]|jgi:DNA-binding transcriptional LysR family regulator|nr:LysR family transcriptional regulator [Paracoccaceae bacterium]
MHIDQLRTFLEVAETRNFNKASSNLNVTQSTVSARIRTLEDRLKQPVFYRNATGVTLTPAGIRLREHAINIVRLWQRAEGEASAIETFDHSIGLGTVLSVASEIFPDWIGRLRRQDPRLQIHVYADFSSYLMRQLSDGLIDVAVMYEPRPGPGIVLEELFEDEIVLAASPETAAGDWRRGYFFVDWGPDFQRVHDSAFANIAASTRFALGTLAMDHVLRHGGSGYFSKRMIRDQLRDGRLVLIEGMPAMQRTAYAVHAEAATDKAMVVLARNILREVLAPPVDAAGAGQVASGLKP